MAISSVATLSATPTPVTNFSSSGSISDIANEFSSLLANFSAPAGQSGQQAPAPQSLPSSSAGVPQSSTMMAGMAYMFVSQTTTTTTSGPSSASPAEPPLFASIDASGNGLIDRQEFVNKFGGNGSQTSASQLFNVLDRNGDSSIDGTELAPSKAATTGSSPVQTQASQGPAASMPTLTAMPAAPMAAVAAAPLSTAPTVPDGVTWSPSSLFLRLPGMQEASLPGTPTLPVFTRLDTDQNGLLSQAEFATAYGANVGQGLAAFASVDGNGNGTVDWSELNNAQLEPPGAAAPIASSAPSTTTTTTTTASFFAELIQLQAELTTGSTTAPASAGSGSTTPVTGGSSTPAGSTDTSASSSTGATTTPANGGSSSSVADATTSPAGSSGSSSTGTSTSGSSSTVADATTTAPANGSASTSDTSSTSTTTADAGTTTPADPAAVIADAAAGKSTAPADTSQTVANLQSELLDALDPTNGSTATSSIGSTSKA